MRQGKVLYTTLGISILIIVLFIGLVGGFRAYQKYQSRQAQLCFSKAEAFYNNKKYLEAAKEYEFVANNYPRSEHVPACWYKAGYIYRRFLLDDAAGAKALQKLLALFPASQYRKEALVLLVDIYARLGQYKEQNDIINRLIADFPGALNEDALRLELAKGFYKRGQFKDALEQLALIKNKESNVVKYSQEYYQLLSYQDPFDPQPHLELSRIYKGMGLQQRAVDEFDTAKRIKKNAAALKDAPQKATAPAKYARGPMQKKVPPKIKLLPREEKLYIEYTLAQERYWPAAMYEKGLSLGPQEKEQEAAVSGEILQQYEKEWWSDWYAKNQTSNDECEKIRAKVINDQGTVMLLNEKIAQITQ